VAINKNATLRYNALDKCFGNPYKRFYIEDLIEYVGATLSHHYGEDYSVSRRQILDDITFMRSAAGFQAPIASKRDGKKVYYRYAEPGYSIHQQVLTPEEEAQLKDTLKVLSQIKALSGMNWIGSVTARIFSGLDFDHRRTTVISFEENEYLSGLNHVYPLFNYIINKSCLSIEYKPFKSKAVEKLLISPSYLKQYNNRWFLFGVNHKLKTLQNLALDRIISVNPNQESYLNSQVNFDEYFDDIIGVTNVENVSVEEVKIKLSDSILPYIHSKPIHGSQLIKDKILTLKVKPNYELESLILSFGEHFEVCSPESMKQRIANRIRTVNKIYECSSLAQVC